MRSIFEVTRESDLCYGSYLMSVFSAGDQSTCRMLSILFILIPNTLDQVLAPGVPSIFCVDLVNFISFLNLFEYFLIYEKVFLAKVEVG